MELIHLSSAMAVIGTCNSTFSASAGVVGTYVCMIVSLLIARVG